MNTFNYSRFCEGCKIPDKNSNLCKTCPFPYAVVTELDDKRASTPGREEDGRSFGLSNNTYLTDGVKYAVEMYQGGSLIKFTPIGLPPRPQVGGGVRGKVTKFSREARKRMIKKLAEFDRETLSKALFITLTYPAEYPDGKRAKRDFFTFCKRLKRKYPGAGWLWREELQKRGAPHYHMLVMGVDFIPYQWVASAWYEVCGRISDKHLKAGTEVRRVKSYKHCVYYVSKYLAKEDLEVEAELGRRWGVGGLWRRFIGSIRLFVYARGQAAQLARCLDGMYKSYRRSKGRRYLKRKRFAGCRAFWLTEVNKIVPRIDEIVIS